MLATASTVRGCLAVEGSIKILIQILQEHIANRDLTTLACAALTNSFYKQSKILRSPLTDSIDFNKTVFLQGKGFPRLHDILRHYKEDEKPATYAALALRSLCHMGMESSCGTAKKFRTRKR